MGHCCKLGTGEKQIHWWRQQKQHPGGNQSSEDEKENPVGRLG